MEITALEIAGRGAGRPGETPHDTALRSRAQDLEAAFLAEMLSYAGLEAQEGSFSGGAGETQFASFQRDAQARQMVQHGGIGLAEQIFHSLKRREFQT
ncbi:rod-binding protein [Tabrizicola fusiformis]|uniref:rod-binding protein n=1 Tax=Tabrizicola sp. SY72 TaxID=2741673 RepID=UPI00157178D6|nr:rod-binding protein [Tabrizicola sp. SY72]NTT86687.1 rod-binding protein [Tabrizicola sp. SY72]